MSFILGSKIPDVLYQVLKWPREHPCEDIPTGTCSPNPDPSAEGQAA